MADRAFNSYPGAPSIAGDETLLIAQGGVTLNTTPDQILQAGLVPTFGDTTVRNLIFTANQSVSNVLAAPTATPGIPVWRQLSTDDIGGMGVFFSSPPPIGDVTPNLVYSSGGALNGTIGATTPNTGAFTALSGLVTATGSPTARTLADRAADWVNVKNFGAKLNGTTNDGASFNASAAAAITSGGNIVSVPAGATLLTGITTPASPILWQTAGTTTNSGGMLTALPGVVQGWYHGDAVGRLRTLRTVNTSASDYATQEFYRSTTHTGGTTVNISHNLVVSTAVGAGAGNQEWNFQAQITNNSANSMAVASFSQGVQAVRAVAGTTQGSIVSISDFRDQTGTADPVAPSVSFEFNIEGNGTDLTAGTIPGTTQTGYRTFLHAALNTLTGYGSTAPVEAARGLWFSGNSGASNRLYTGILFTNLDMNVAVDTSYATFSTGGPAIRLGAGQSLEFNGEVATRRLSYVTADAAMEYKVGGTTRWSVSDAGLVSGFNASFSNRRANITTPVFVLAGNASGITTSAAPMMKSSTGLISGTVAGSAVMWSNYFETQNDTADARNANSGEIVNLTSSYSFGGAGFAGARMGFQSIMTMTGDTTNPSVNTFHRGIGIRAQTSYKDGGTVGTPNGNWFGQIIDTGLKTGAMYWNSLCGMEIDTSIESGASAKWLIALQLVQKSTHVTKASDFNAALSITNQTGGSPPGYDTAISFGAPNGVWAPTTTMIGTTPTALGGPAYAAVNGIDFSPVTFSGSFLKSTGFSVDGSGNQTAKNVINTGARADQSADVYVATAAGSRTIPNGCSWECLTPAGTIASFTTTMPAAPIDKQEVWISTTQTITTWTLNPNTGQTINGAPTTLGANTSVQFRYNLATTTWFRMI